MTLFCSLCDEPLKTVAVKHKSGKMVDIPVSACFISAGNQITEAFCGKEHMQDWLAIVRALGTHELP